MSTVQLSIPLEMDQSETQPITNRSGRRTESLASTSEDAAGIPQRQLRSSTEAFLIGHSASATVAQPEGVKEVKFHHLSGPGGPFSI